MSFYEISTSIGYVIEDIFQFIYNLSYGYIIMLAMLFLGAFVYLWFDYAHRVIKHG